MKGIWEGYYKYDNERTQNLLGVKKTYFKMNINFFEEDKFKGTVEDDVESKGSPGIGNIIGEMHNDKVEFTKQMPTDSVIFPTGRLYSFKGKSTIINYEGIKSIDGKTIEGNWKIEPNMYSILPTTGTWKMSLKY